MQNPTMQNMRRVPKKRMHPLSFYLTIFLELVINTPTPKLILHFKERIDKSPKKEQKK
jgi:hypothetical protein